MNTPDPNTYRLSSADVQRFIDQGYLILERCIPRQSLDALVRNTLERKDPMPTYRGRHGNSAPKPIKDIDLADPESWPVRWLAIDTNRSVPIEQLAPKLWGALISLIGDEDQIARRTMGEQFLLNADYRPEPRPKFTRHYVLTDRNWHIDVASAKTTLEARNDALALLVLWSDVDPGGGGPLYSGESLTHTVRQLESSDTGVDTLSYEWGTEILSNCDDVFEFTGKAGDVLITHPLSLHAPQENYSTRLRILENPTIFVRGTLNYSPDNPNPSPVEDCVIKRRRATRTVRQESHAPIAECSALLVDKHPDYFLPGRELWTSRTTKRLQKKVHELDRTLALAWCAEIAQRITSRQPKGLARIETAIALCRDLFVNQLSFHAHITESVIDPDFDLTTWSRMLRGFVNCEGQNQLLAMLLIRLVDRVQYFDTSHEHTVDGGHLLLRIESEDSWAFADAWSPNQLFYVDSMSGDPIPGIPEYAELPTQGNRPDLGVFSREAYEQGTALKLPIPTGTSKDLAACTDKVRTASSEDPNEIPTQASGIWQKYLLARTEHAVANYDRARDGYRQLRSKLKRGGATARVAETFEKRITADGSASIL